MAKPYRVNTFVRINNTMATSLLRLGIKVWSFSLLTVRGRKSGKPIVTPVAIFVQDQKRYLVATYGIVNWVRNLRAAGGEATLTRRRHSGMYLIGCTYKFCFAHHELSKASHVGSLCTPAMAAGLTNHLWSVCELLRYKIAPLPGLSLAH